MYRPQFSLKTLLWLMAVAAAFCAGMVLQKRLDEPTITRSRGFIDEMELRDGTRVFHIKKM
jgi:hypothetical protein